MTIQTDQNSFNQAQNTNNVQWSKNNKFGGSAGLSQEADLSMFAKLSRRGIKVCVAPIFGVN